MERKRNKDLPPEAAPTAPIDPARMIRRIGGMYGWHAQVLAALAVRDALRAHGVRDADGIVKEVI